ncbi:MAG: hypothetical protein ABJ092_03475 [Gillisia sp.]
MTWYNIKKLERRLGHDELSEKESLHYLLALLIIMSICIFFPDSVTSYSDFSWYFIEFGFFLGTLIYAIHSAYKINSRGQNRDFARRFISLTVVHGLRLLIWVAVLGLLYKIIMFIIPLPIFLFINEILLPNWTDLVVFTGIFFLFALLLIKSFKRINSPTF